MKYVQLDQTGECIAISSVGGSKGAVINGINFIEVDDSFSAENTYYKEGSFHVKPPQPEHHVWDVVTKTWENTQTLAAVKEAKLKEINISRARANQLSFTFQGKEIAADPLSRSDIDGVNGEVSLTGALPSNWPGAWKAKDNTYVGIPSVAVWIQFYQAMTAQGTANFLHSQTLKATVSAATTIEAVEACVW